MNNLLTLEISNNPKFKVYNLITDKIHNCSSKTSVRNLLRSLFNIRGATLSNLLNIILTEKCINKSYPADFIDNYLKNGINVDKDKDNDKVPSEKIDMDKDKIVHSDIHTKCPTVVSSWISRDDFFFNTNIINNDLMDLTNKLDRVLMTSQILQNENALLKNQIKLLNEKVDIISTNNTETIKTCKSEISQMIQVERMLNTINESSIASETVIKTPKKHKTKHKHKHKNKTKTKNNLYDLLLKIHN